jgi:hypothetical protein
MTKLEEIEAYAHRRGGCPECDRRIEDDQVDWLINRVKVLTEALEKADRHIYYLGDKNYKTFEFDDTGERPGEKE